MKILSFQQVPIAVSACDTTSAESTSRERQVSVLKKLLPQEFHLLPNPSLVRIPHPWASLPVMGVLPNTYLRKRGLFAYVNSREHDMKNLRAIRRSHRLR